VAASGPSRGTAGPVWPLKRNERALTQAVREEFCKAPSRVVELALDSSRRPFGVAEAVRSRGFACIALRHGMSVRTRWDDLLERQTLVGLACKREPQAAAERRRGTRTVLA
jgi:hypothetical protein